MPCVSDDCSPRLLPSSATDSLPRAPADLDMNGIIHNCSHPDDNNASFRITEEAIFLAVFAYISHLFTVIKPQKLFYLAVDGVAPRAKMNQQRSRRFRTAKEMKEVVDKARRKGEDIPEGDGFDSNCITPGEFSTCRRGMGG